MYVTKTRIFLAFLFFLPLLGAPAPVRGFSAENRAVDVNFQARKKEGSLALKLSHFSGCTIETAGPGKILLRVSNTLPDPLLLTHLRKWKNSLQLLPDGAKDLGLSVKFPGEVREVRYSWDQKENLLSLRFFLKGTGAEKGLPSVPIMLKELRFGMRKKFSRMVMDLTARPRWKVTCGGGAELRVGLKGVRAEKGTRNYAPRKGNIKKVQLMSRPGELNIILYLETPETDFRLFWLESGRRLVLDSSGTPDRSVAEAISLPPGFGTPGKSSPDGRDIASEVKVLFQEAMPEPMPDAVSMPLAASQKERPARIPRQTEKASKIIEKNGPSITIPIPKPIVSKVGKKDHGPTAMPVESREPEMPAEKNLKFDPKEAALYGKILQAGNSNHPDEELAFIEQFLSRYPKSAICEKFWFMRANILFSQLQNGKKGMLEKVVEAYQDVINRFPHSSLALESYVRMAKSYAMKGNQYLGISCLDLAIQRYDKSPNIGFAYLERGEIYLDNDLSEKAVGDFKTVLKRDQSSHWAPAALFGIARYLQARGLYREAQKRLSRIEKMRPDFFLEKPGLLSVQAQNYLYLKDYPKARAYFFQAINLTNQQEKDDLLLMHIGDTYLDEKRPKDAEKVYTMVEASYPGSEGAALAEIRLGVLHADVNKFKEVRKKHPKASIADIATLKMASAYYKAGLNKKAMDTLRQLVSKPPRNSMLVAARSLFRDAAESAMDDLYKKGKFKEVVALFDGNAALLKEKIRPEKQLLLAQSLKQEKEYQRAISAYRVLQPSDVALDKRGTYYLDLAECLSSSGYTEKSIHLLEEARKAQVSSGDKLRITCALANRYMAEKRFRAAYDLYAGLIQGKVNFNTRAMARIYLSMGGVLNAQGKYQKARADLNRSILLSEHAKELKPLLLSALGKLGEGYLQERKYRDALEAYTHAFHAGYEKSQPGYWDVKLGQAEALLGEGQRSAAENVLNAIYEERGPGPRYWDLRYHLAVDYVKAGNLQTGEKLLREVSEEGTPALQSDAQIKLGSLGLRMQLEKLSIWPQIGDGKDNNVSQ